MTTAVRFELTGVAELMRDLNAFSGELKAKALTRGLRKAMTTIQHQSATTVERNRQSFVLTDRQAKRDRLSSGIQVKIKDYETAVFAIVGPQHKFRHGRLLETGHRVVVRTDRGPNYRNRKRRYLKSPQTTVKPYPFLQPSADAVKSQIAPIMQQEITKVIRNFNRQVDRNLAAKGGQDG